MTAHQLIISSTPLRTAEDGTSGAPAADAWIPSVPEGVRNVPKAPRVPARGARVALVAAGEYEYYEFRTLDRPLKDAEYDQVRAGLPRHARVTHRRVQSECYAGDFEGDPAVLMDRYFDAHLFCTNSGIRVLMVRLPLERFDLDAAAQYTFVDSGPARHPATRREPFSIRQSGGHAVVTWRSEDTGDGWAEDTRISLSRLVRTRAELEMGDLRPLYLGWLTSLGGSRDPRYAEPDADGWCEPPVPPGLKTLTHAQRGLVDFLRLDRDLLAAAAQTGREPDNALRVMAERAVLSDGDAAAVRPDRGQR